MTDTLNASQGKTWRDVALLLAVMIVLLGPSLFTRDLWNPDEPRYMEVGREIALTGNYLVPHLNGYVYPDKPPMFFWITAGFYRLGAGLLAGRLVAALAAIGIVMATYVMGRRLLSHAGALVAGLATATSLLFLLITRAGVIDPLVTFFMVCAIACGIIACDPGTRRYRLWWLGAYAAAGLGMLTKGPVALAVPGVVLLVYLLFMRRPGASRNWRLGGAAVLAMASGGGVLAAGLHLLHKGYAGKGSWRIDALLVMAAGVACLCAGVAWLVKALADRSAVRHGGWIHAAGLALCLAMFLSWLAPAVLAGGEEYTNDILFSQVSRRLIKSDSHRGPFYEYVAQAPLLFMPWAFIGIPAYLSALRAWHRGRDRTALVGLIWFTAILAFFSLVSGKRMGYILPLMPGFGLLVGRYLALPLEGRGWDWPVAHRRLLRATLIALCGAAGIAALIVLLAAPATGWLQEKATGDLSLLDDFTEDVETFVTGMFPATAAAAVGIVLLAALGWRRAAEPKRTLLPVVTLTGIVLVASIATDVALLPRANVFKSGRNFVEAARAPLTEATEICLYPKDFSGVYNLYTGEIFMEILPTPEALAQALAKPTRVAVITRDADVHKALGNPIRVGRIAATQRVGHRKMVLVTNWESAPAAQPASER